jgi:G protein-coupled receptor 125
VTNLTDPVFILLKTPHLDALENTLSVPVWWDPHLNNGSGTWSSEGCHFSHEDADHTVFFCHNFGYYGLLQDVTNLQNNFPGARFKLSHPAIYVGSFILFASLLVVVVTYLICYPSIQMPKKAKHSLINTWIAICFLCFLYVFGIYQTEDV